LQGLTAVDTRTLIAYYASNWANRITLDTIASKVNNNPLAVALAADLLTKHPASSVLSGTDGEIYTIDELNQAGESELIKIVRPKVIDASEQLIYRIRKTPTDLYRISPREFEILIAGILDDMGWEVELTQQSRDGGKDILAYMKTELGLFLCLVEAKKYRPDRPVGIEIVRQLYGTFCDEQANSAMLVTTSRFTRDAHEFQEKHKYQLQLREYAHVVDWLFKFGRK
jgi:restriction endonuclease Mrr